MTKKWMERAGALLALVAVISFFAGGKLIDLWATTRPAIPVPEKGFVIQRESHGAVYFVSKDEEALVDAVYWTAIGGGAFAVCLVLLSQVGFRSAQHRPPGAIQ